MNTVLWPHQAAAIASGVRAWEKSEKHGLWVMPTGTGKTKAFTSLAAKLAQPTLVVVHREELVRQAWYAFGEDWPEASRSNFGEKSWEQATVVVGTVQKLSLHLDDIPLDRFQLVVVDEAHHTPAPSWKKVVTYLKPRLLLGCTATPERADGKELGGLFGHKPLFTYGLDKAIDEGYLVPLRQHGIVSGANLDEIRVRGRDFVAKDLAMLVANQQRNKAIVDGYLQLAPGRPVLVFAIDLKHVEQLRQAFNAARVPATVVTGKMNPTARRQALDEFHDGNKQALIGCEVLTEGYDEKRIGCVIMARPTLSQPLYQQCVGRGLRINPDGGKQDCLVLDILDEPTTHRPLTATSLFRAKVADCKGGDVREAARKERAYRETYPLSATPAKEGRWKKGEETPWEDLPDLTGYVPSKWRYGDPATDKQLKALGRYGMEVHRDLTKGEADHLLAQCDELDKLYFTPATPRQEWRLKTIGVWRPGMSKREATKAIVRDKYGY